MTTTPPPERWPGVETRDQIIKLLPILALFTRVSIGLALVNTAFLGLLSSQAGPNAWPPTNNMGGARGPLDNLNDVMPYLELAVGLGLTFGIFTTIMALATCGLAILTPLAMVIELMSALSIGQGMGGRGMGFGGRGGLESIYFSLILPVVATPILVLLVVLSPLSINRFSLDALIFQRRVAFPEVAAEPNGEQAGA